MIDNKTVTIKKNNTFDKGWTLVSPYQAEFLKNKRFRALNIYDIVRAITKSTKVNLILSEPCLSSQIVKELEWANKYIEINLIAKGKEIATRYSQLKFNKVSIDNSIDFNYIAIKGTTDLFALIAENYVAVDASLNNVYFENAKPTSSFDFIKNAKSVIFVDENNDKDYANLLDECIKANIPTSYLVGAKAYNQELVHKFLKLNAKLLCSENVKNGILFSTDDGSLYCANLTNKGVYVTVEIESALYYLGQTFASLKCDDTVNVNKIPSGSYICNKGIIPLKINDEKIINRTVQIDLMEDFVSEQFDKSETDKHNQYCTEAKCVVYNFTLVPPLFSSDKISDIYAEADDVFVKWQENFNKINLSDIIGFLNDLELSESGLCLLCNELVSFNNRLSKIVKERNYKNYYSDVKNLSGIVNYASIDDYSKELFLKVNAESSDTKFNKFDNEILGYQKTIEEKKALIEKGVEILSNKRRVEILEKKIADLTAMKQRFSGSASARDNKQLDAFLTVCKQVVEGKFVEEQREVDSIGNILATKELSKMAKLEWFTKTYLYQFNRFILVAKEIIKQLDAVDIPTDYVVYEQDGKKVIAIESEQEFYDTENIRKRFDLYCVARR